MRTTQQAMIAAAQRGLRNFHTWLTSLPWRVTVLALACFALNLASDLGNTFGNAPRFGGPLVAWSTFLAFLLFFALTLVALADAAWLRAHLPQRFASFRWRPFLLYPLLALSLWTAAQSLQVMAHWPATLASPRHYGSDEMYYAHYNAWLLLHGQNPYAGEHLSGALRHFGVENITPLRAGAYTDPLRPPTKAQEHALVAAYLANPRAPHPNIAPATTHSYPALSFLIAVPSVWAGVPTLGYAQVAALLALIACCIALAPAPLRLPIALLCLLDADGLRSVAGSDFAIWTAAGVALVWILGTGRDETRKTRSGRNTRRNGVLSVTNSGEKEEGRAFSLFQNLRALSFLRVLRVSSFSRPYLAALALGAVCAVQQTAWFFAPFYLVWVGRARGWRALLREGAMAAGAFVVINLPWMIASSGEWLRSLALPMTLPLFPTGGGLVGLGLGGALPLFPAAAYTALELLAYALLLVCYARWLPRLPYAGMLLPPAALLLAWRSPSRYFILLPFLAIVALVLSERCRAHAVPDASSIPAQDQVY